MKTPGTLPVILLSAAAFGHLFVLWLQTGRIWTTEHYTFFPIGLIAVVVLWTQRRDEINEAATKSSSLLSSILLTVNVAAVVFATLQVSGFLGWLSWLFFLGAFTYTFFGWGGFWKSLPVLMMLCAITPLPVSLDQRLVLQMQYLATKLASIGLDVFGVVHIKQGVVIVSAQQAFLAEEACSGIRSLFSTLAATLFWGFIHRYHFVRHGVNLLQAIFWIVMLNAIRIMAVVLVEDWSDYSIASGWPHETLGFLIFFIIIGFVLSTDSLIRAFFPLQTGDEEWDRRGREKKNSNPGPWTFPLHAMPSEKVVYAFATLFLIAGLLGIRIFSLSPEVASSVAGNLPSMTAKALPDQLDDWKVSSFREITRDRGDLQGEKSFIWELSAGERRVTVSVDGDWQDYHELSECYSGLGWTVAKNFMYPSIREKVNGDEDESSPQCTQLTMSRLTGEQAVGFFSAVDHRGTIVYPRQYIDQDMWFYAQEKAISQLSAAFGLGRPKRLREVTFAPPVSTVQLMYEAKEPLEEKTITTIRKLFLEVREILKQDARFGGT